MEDKKVILLENLDWGSRAGLIAGLLADMPWEELKREKAEYLDAAKEHPESVPHLTEAGQYSADAYNEVLDIAEAFQKKFKVKPRKKFGHVPLFEGDRP